MIYIYTHINTHTYVYIYVYVYTCIYNLYIVKIGSPTACFLEPAIFTGCRHLRANCPLTCVILMSMQRVENSHLKECQLDLSGALRVLSSGI